MKYLLLFLPILTIKITNPMINHNHENTKGFYNKKITKTKGFYNTKKVPGLPPVERLSICNKLIEETIDKELIGNPMISAADMGENFPHHSIKELREIQRTLFLVHLLAYKLNVFYTIEPKMNKSTTKVAKNIINQFYENNIDIQLLSAKEFMLQSLVYLS